MEDRQPGDLDRHPDRAAVSPPGSLWLPSNRGDYAIPLTGAGVARAQNFGFGLPKRIRLSGLTLLTPTGAHTTAGQPVQTLVLGGPTAAGETRYFTVVRGPKGKVSVRTLGHRDLKLVVIQRAPATSGYAPAHRRVVFVGGRRR